MPAPPMTENTLTYMSVLLVMAHGAMPCPKNLGQELGVGNVAAGELVNVNAV
jgi:hypothetical protein